MVDLNPTSKASWSKPINDISNLFADLFYYFILLILLKNDVKDAVF